MEMRTFGKTGESFSILSFGAQRIVDGHSCSEAEAIRMVNYALDHGIRYFDTAWVYSQGQSEERVGKVAKHRRQRDVDCHQDERPHASGGYGPTRRRA